MQISYIKTVSVLGTKYGDVYSSYIFLVSKCKILMSSKTDFIPNRRRIRACRDEDIKKN